MNKTLIILGILVFFNSCATLETEYYVLLLNYDGEKVIRDEINVKRYLENILSFSNDYVIKAYLRKAISYKIKNSKYKHGFYVIKNREGIYDTISFSATAKTPYSKGSWEKNSISDKESYELYIRGNNIWQVEEIYIANGIDTKLTVENILKMMSSNISYYYRDNINNKEGYNNCITALYETLMERHE